MSARIDAPGTRLLALWRTLDGVPLGSRIFSMLLARMVPYSGTIGARVEVLEPGYARVSLADRRKVRNHLGSIHAIALANLGELTSGLAMLVGLGPGTRGIVTRLDVRYMKKARGPLVAESRIEPGVHGHGPTVQVRAEIRDRAGDVVATTVAHWQLGPEPGA